MSKYVRNEEGAVHSVTDEHFEDVLHETTDSGRRYLLHGWTEISEAEARASHPQLFGKPDPTITYTSKELKEVRDRQAWDRELAEEEAAFVAAQSAAEEPAPPAEPPAEPAKK